MRPSTIISIATQLYNVVLNEVSFGWCTDNHDNNLLDAMSDKRQLLTWDIWKLQDDTWHTTESR